MTEYAGHLASLQEKTSVVATEDIMSDTGILIAKSGASISKKMCSNMLKFKLMKPLEDTIFIENQLNPKAIFNQVIDLINRDAYLKALNSKLGNVKALQQCCLQLDQYPLLLQKLTVLDMEITHVFHQSIISAYLGALCGIIEKSSLSTIKENFLAGLVHDIGLLHIDRYIITKQETLSAEEWRKVQSHPLIAYEILKRIPHFPANVSRAVLEHHENLDGSGYPRAKALHDLGSLGQLINLLDNVIVIYNKKFKPLKRSLNDVIPIVQMTMHSYYPKIVSVIFRVLKEVPPTTVAQNECEILEDLVPFVQAQQTYINTIATRIKNCNHSISFTHETKELFAIQNIGINILVILNSAGLTEESSLDWSQQMEQHENEQELYSEVEDTRLVQEEIIYQLGTYQKAANVFINQNPDNEFIDDLTQALTIFYNTNRPQTPDAIKQYWQQLTKR